MSIAAIIPASGNASRMRGFPKFLLPNGPSYETLLEAHLKSVAPFVDEIRIAVNPMFKEILMGASLFLHDADVESMETLSMTETVLNLISRSTAEKFIVIMPDTAFLGESPYQKLFNGTKDLNLSIWKIRDEQKGKLGQVLIGDDNCVLDCIDKDPDCDYEFAWGLQYFNRKYLNFLSPDQPHIGYGIVPAIKAGLSVGASTSAGSYWDCGTPSEFISYCGEKAGQK